MPRPLSPCVTSLSKNRKAPRYRRGSGCVLCLFPHRRRFVLSPRGRSVAPTGVVRYIGTRWLSPIEPARKACFLQRNTRTGREDRTP